MNYFKQADRLAKLPPYVFAVLDKLKAEVRAKGRDLIDLTIGSPSHLPPAKVIQAHIEALKDPINHKYSSFEGDPKFLEAIAGWCERQYGLKVEKEEVAVLVGSKEGLAHFYFAYLNPGDTLLVPVPIYPSHVRAPVLAGALPVCLPCKEENNFLPELEQISPAVADKAKILTLSYPTNPTAAVATKEFFAQAVAFAKKHNLILLHDFAYAELYFDNQKPVSCLSLPGAKDVCIEFHSLSKTFGMAGWRLGFAIGHPELTASLREIKTNLDYGPFGATVKAGTVALNMTNGYLDKMRHDYQQKRDVVIDGMNELGWKLKKPQATFYIWFPVPKGFTSMTFVHQALDQADVAVSPGHGFGEAGEGYVRIALVDNLERTKEAMSRLKKAGIKYA